MKEMLGLVMLATVAEANSRSSTAHGSDMSWLRGLRTAYAAHKRAEIHEEADQNVYDSTGATHRKCRAAQLIADVCATGGRDTASYAKELNDMAEAHKSKVGIGDLSTFRQNLVQAIQLLPVTNASFSQHGESDSMPQDKAQEILGVWDQISHWSGEHVFALQETWTDADTQLLQALDPQGGFGNTTAEIRRSLPSIKDLERIRSNKRYASVGSGSTLKGGNMGSLIDEHEEVVRFNNLVGEALDAKDTGTKTTLHVINQFVKGQAGLPLFDLETTCLWTSYCNRKWQYGQWSHHEGPVFLLRPTARCGMPGQINHFSRGFLFYWFTGSEVPNMDLYGFQGSMHYISPNREDLYSGGDFMGEMYIKFEHLIYNQVQKTAKSNETKRPPLSISSRDEHGEKIDPIFPEKHAKEFLKSPTDDHVELTHLQRLASHLQRAARGSEILRKIISFTKKP